MSKSLAISLIIVFFIIGIGVGYTLTPEYTPFAQASGTHAKDLGKADRYLDLRYINGMIAHHMSAIDLLTQVKANSKRAELLGLVEPVITADTKGIADLYAWKHDWYNNNRKITQFQKVNLGKTDDKFDLRFLNAMIAHHEEAINTSKEMLTKSSRSEMLDLANGVITTLSSKLVLLKAWREQWYSIK